MPILGGCLEDGTPVRLYPVPLRLLPEQSRYALWDWIKLDLGHSKGDSRPESRRLLSMELRKTGHLGTAHGWEARRQVVFRNRDWHYPCVEVLREKQRTSRTSIGMVKIGDVQDVRLVARPSEEREEHHRKLRRLQSQRELFDKVQDDLEFFPHKIMVRWKCDDLAQCPGHRAGVLDWGLGELARRSGAETAKRRMEELSNLGEYDLHFFMGNFFLHQHNFGIVGVWYPKKRHMQQTDLFTPPRIDQPRLGEGD